jgi:hypothetical protein
MAPLLSTPFEAVTFFIILFINFLQMARLVGRLGPLDERNGIGI